MKKEIFFAVILISFAVPLLIITIVWEQISQHENLALLD